MDASAKRAKRRSTSEKLEWTKHEKLSLSLYVSLCLSAYNNECILVYLDAELLGLPPPVLSSGLCFCWLPIFGERRFLVVFM